jgi:hypothetical protein
MPINPIGMNMPSFVPKGRLVISPVVSINASKPLNILETLEDRLSQRRLMWFLDNVASPFMGDVIVDRFAYEGDKTVGGPWPPLAAYTVRLKRSMGMDDGINERTGGMLHHLAYDHAVEPWTLGALLRIPDRSDALMEKKIRTAQEGESAAANPLGGATPPRPVLGMGTTEELGLGRLFDTYLWAGIN